MTFQKSLVGLAAFGAVAAANAQTFSTTVDFQSNIFGYGVSTPSGAGGGGVLAPVMTLTPGVGRTMTVSASGTANSGPGWDNHGVDGGVTQFAGGPVVDTNISGVGPISGYAGPGFGYLLGVFIEDGDISGLTAPAAMSYPSAASYLSTSFAPGLRQVFFIGDGKAGAVSQTFSIPDGAGKLVLGIADSGGYNGSPSWYGDNTGSFAATVSAVPEPASMAAVGLGIAGLLRRRAKKA